jgi:glycosyltransferase involved in cell wall biosynthesis
VVFIQNDLDKPGFIPRLITSLYLQTFFKLTLSLADRILVVNKNWREYFTNTKAILEKYKTKIIEVPNGVDTTIFKPLNNERDLDLILFVSILDNHHKFKGLDYLLDAVRQLAKEKPKTKLIVVGEGELKDYYEKKIREDGYEKNVEFVGAKSQTELVDYYNRAGIFVLPSIDIEGFGIVAIEALACGLPAIVSDIVGSAEDIKKHEAGLIVKPRSSKELENGINQLQANPKLLEEMGTNGRNLVERKCSWERISQQIGEIYQGLIYE